MLEKPERPWLDRLAVGEVGAVSTKPGEWITWHLDENGEVRADG